MTAKVAPAITKRQLVLLALARDGRLIIPRFAERCGCEYMSVSNIMRALMHELLAELIEVIPHTGHAPATKVYGPTPTTRAAIRIPFDTPIEQALASAAHEPPRPKRGPRPGGGRPRGVRSSGSGVIAGKITIPQYRWGSGRLI